MDLKLIETILAIIIMVFLGYGMRMSGLLKYGDAKSLNKIVVNLAIPSLIFMALYRIDISVIPSLIPIPLICILIGLISGLIAYFWGKMKGYSKKTLWSIMLPVIMLNSGFLGYPIALGVFGVNGLVRAIFYDLGSILVFIGLGIILLAIFGGSKRDVLNRAMLFPPLWSIILGLMANYFNFPIGFVLSDVLTFLSGAAIPLIMISLGLSMELKGIKEHLTDAAFVSVARLIISPALAVLIVSIFGLGGLERTVTIMEAAMPSAMLSVVLAITYDLDIKLTASCVFFSTILSLITLPLVLSIL
ncbi:MAG: transporter [Methanobacteriales archaeon HGW-Methanobacteriales-1]|jgi:hypothetical protein|nr:MAG: transporter [Methanobacteriales archaeon HGW-Methanobacteriales-1]